MTNQKTMSLTKPSQEVFNSVAAIDAEITRQTETDFYPCVGEEFSLMQKLLTIMDNYDFTNEIIEGADGKQGVRWCWGGAMIEPVYDAVKAFSRNSIPVKGCFTIVEHNGEDVLVNSDGKEVFRAEELLPSDGVITPARFRRGSRWGLVRGTGQIIAESRYNSIECAGNGFFFIEKEGKWGLIEPGGFIIEPKFDCIEVDEDENIIVSVGSESGYLDSEGSFTTNPDEAFYSLTMFF